MCFSTSPIKYRLCPFHTTDGMPHSYRCSSAVEPPHRPPNFIRVVHTTDGMPHSYRCSSAVEPPHRPPNFIRVVHTTDGMPHSYRCSSAVEPPHRPPNFIRVVHTTDGVINGYRLLAKRPCSRVRDSYTTLCHSCEMSMYFHSPYIMILHQTPPYVHRGPHLRLPY